MRILYSIHSVNPAGGGPIEAVRQLLSLHNRVGDTAAVVSLDDPGEQFVEDFPFQLSAVGPSTPGFGWTSRYLPWLRSNVHKFDAVIVNGLWQYSDLGAWLVLRRAMIPYMVYAHGMLDPWFSSAYPLKYIKKSIYWPVEYHILRDAASVLFASEEERLRARHSFKPYDCREAVVGYGLGDAPGEADQQKSLFFARYPHLADRRFLLFMSRIHNKKGCDLLLQVFAALAGQYPDLDLVVTGPEADVYGGMLRQRFTEDLGDRVTWTGMLLGDLKWGALRAADALVLPSHHENFGIVVAEALSCGTPVLISDKINIYREIANAGAGLVAPDTLDGTRQMLVDWLSMSKDKREQMRMRTRGCFDVHFRVEGVHQRLRNLIEQRSSSSAAGTTGDCLNG